MTGARKNLCVNRLEREEREESEEKEDRNKNGGGRERAAHSQWHTCTHAESARHTYAQTDAHMQGTEDAMRRMSRIRATADPLSECVCDRESEGENRARFRRWTLSAAIPGSAAAVDPILLNMKGTRARNRILAPRSLGSQQDLLLSSLPFASVLPPPPHLSITRPACLPHTRTHMQAGRTAEKDLRRRRRRCRRRRLPTATLAQEPRVE